MISKHLKREFTTVTPFSKAVALALFILLPLLTFYCGTLFQSIIDAQKFATLNNRAPKYIYIRVVATPTPTVKKLK